MLLEAGWIRPRGRRRTPGRPVTWGTSQDFLDHFGLASLEDLPGVAELKAAGLLDARPALNVLAARGQLLDADQVSEEALDGEEAAERLPAHFGEDLLDPDAGELVEEEEAASRA